MRSVGKYLAIAWISAKTNMAYLSEVGSRLLFLAIVLFILLRLWQSTFAHSATGRLAGFTLNQILWYIAITESIVMSAPRLSVLIDEDVRTGSICIQLVRPVAYPMFRLFVYIGERIVRFVVTMLAAAVVALFFVGPAEFSASAIASFALVLLLAFVIDFCGLMLIGLAAFWIEDTNGLTLLYTRMVMVLGGMLAPLQLFPDWLRAVANALPFANIICGPARALVEFNASEVGALVGQQCLWMAILGLAVASVYRLGLQRIAANGG